MIGFKALPHKGLRGVPCVNFFVSHQKKLHKNASVSLFAACLAASSCGWIGIHGSHDVGMPCILCRVLESVLVWSIVANVCLISFSDGFFLTIQAKVSQQVVFSTIMHEFRGFASLSAAMKKQ